MLAQQLNLFSVTDKQDSFVSGCTMQERVQALLRADLDFHGMDGSYATHNFHSFPAKYPPQLPLKFICELTEPGDVVLDPMMGSGTTLVEAYLSGRQAYGFGIDPLAIRLVKAKTTPLDKHHLIQAANKIIQNATNALADKRAALEATLQEQWDSKTKEFIDYWFVPDVQIGLWALLHQIAQLDDEATRTFFEVVLSATIITKSGGVSLALDLAHTRPHRAKIVYSETGELLFGGELLENPSPRLRFQTKRLRSPIEEFSSRFQKNLSGLPEPRLERLSPVIRHGNSQKMDLPDKSVDLIVTSPPYAANAIDYMRAHKFSLVWLGHTIDTLSETRGEYIGGESTSDVQFETLPAHTQKIVKEIDALDAKKGLVLQRYYSEMTRALGEMYRVLKPGKAAVVVVGSSILRGQDTETGACLAEIGEAIGFDVPHIGVRTLDRNRRMMPAGAKVDRTSQIQQRMHQEYVIGLIATH